MEPYELTHLQKVVLYCRKSFLIVFIFSFIVNLLILTVPVYMLQLFDRVIVSGSVDTLLFLTIISVVAILVMALLDATRQRVLAAVGRWLDNQLGVVSLLRSVDNILQGGTYGRQSLRDIDTIRNFISGHSLLALFDMPWTPVFLLVIFILNFWLGLISLIGGIILFSLAYLNEVYTRAILAKADEASIQTQQQVDSAMNNVEVIQSMGMMPQIIKKWFYKNEETLSLQAIASKHGRVILATAKFIRITLQLFILATGAYFVILGRLTAGGMIVASILMARSLSPIEQSISSWKLFVKARQAYTRIYQYLAVPEARGERVTSLPSPEGHIQAENLTYVPPKMSKPIVSGVSFDVEAGETLVVIGPSGAGKSTLARLILGVWKPTFGSVRIDNAVTYFWERSDFGKHVGYLPQYIELFEGTVAENIARMQTGYDKEAVTAAKQVGAHDMILQLVNGYDTDIKKFSLSGGQRQRIALARAFFGSPCIVILDEPSSSLDEEGKHSLEEALINAKKRGITIVLVTHEKNLINRSDKILVLSKGAREVFGPKENVVNYFLKKKSEMSRRKEDE